MVLRKAKPLGSEISAPNMVVSFWAGYTWALISSGAADKSSFKDDGLSIMAIYRFLLCWLFLPGAHHSNIKKIIIIDKAVTDRSLYTLKYVVFLVLGLLHANRFMSFCGATVVSMKVLGKVIVYPLEGHKCQIEFGPKHFLVIFFNY